MWRDGCGDIRQQQHRLVGWICSPANFTCSLIVNVTATGIGTITNTTSAITSPTAAPALPATASLKVEPIISEFPVQTASSNPTYIAVGPDGALWFTEAGSQQDRTDHDRWCDHSEFPSLPPQPALGITAGPDGALWFTEMGQQDRADHDRGRGYRILVPTASSGPLVSPRVQTARCGSQS